MTKNPFKTHPDSYEDWCKKSKFLGKNGLYEEWKPIVKDFEDTYIYKRDITDYCNMMINVLKRLKKSQQSEYIITQWCNEWIEQYKAQSIVSKTDKLDYPIMKADADIYTFFNTGKREILIESKEPLPDHKKLYKSFQSQIRKEFIKHRAEKEWLITETITALSKKYKPKQVSEYLKQLSNGICWFDSQYISRKTKNLRYTSS